MLNIISECPRKLKEISKVKYYNSGVLIIKRRKFGKEITLGRLDAGNLARKALRADLRGLFLSK